MDATTQESTNIANEEMTGTAYSPAYVVSYADNGKIEKIPQPVSGIYHSTSVGESPIGVATDPVLQLIYVTNSDSNTVSVFKTDINHVPTTIPVEENPTGVAVDYYSKNAFVSNRGDDTISIINGNTLKVIQTLKVSGSPFGVGFNYKTRQVYVALSNGNVAIIREGNGGQPYYVKKYVPVDGFPWGVTCGSSEDDNWVTDNTGGNLYKIDSNDEIAKTIELGSSAHPYGLAINNDTSKLYVANSGLNTVSVIDTKKEKVIADIDVDEIPRGVAVDSVSELTYVTNFYGPTVSVIKDTRVQRTLLVNKNPEGIAFMEPNPL